MKQKQIVLPEIESPLAEYLSNEEIFLLGFLQGFDRKANQIISREIFGQTIE